MKSDSKLKFTGVPRKRQKQKELAILKRDVGRSTERSDNGMRNTVRVTQVSPHVAR